MRYKITKTLNEKEQTTEITPKISDVLDEIATLLLDDTIFIEVIE